MSEMQWNAVSFDDEMVHGFPCEEGEYLFTDGVDVIIDDFCVDVDEDGNFTCWLDKRDINRVTAWMPLPKPYKK